VSAAAAGSGAPMTMDGIDLSSVEVEVIVEVLER
jgi:hypothetical protein